ncbi:MAG: beta-ketoacyl-[acyl-carrier-protein] synthase family protein, partial [Planctomycetaceae bacterium]|nr:beta-ketoacyl-[acyl-carrier-protein] synthase family protein [Planctomycetaceae bacterium]
MSLPDQPRIVVTGLGIVSPLGASTAEIWQGLNELEPVNSAPESIGRATFDGKITDFGDLPKQVSRSIRKSLKVMNRETQLGVAAGQKALADGDLSDFPDPERFGVVFGADNVSVTPEDFASGVAACTDSDGQFHPEDWGDLGIEEVAPLWLLKCLPNMPACHLAIINDLRGPNNTITQRDVGANLAIAEACRIIKDGDADAMLVGATGTLFPAFNRLHAELEEELSHGSAPICRPFDVDRIGPAPGEGAAAFVLETLTSAQARRAKIYGEILGYASASLPGCDRPH